MTSNRRSTPALRASVAAVQGALAILGLAMAATPARADEATDELTQPRNTAEVGAIYVDKSSYKFAEYNGLQRQGLNPNASFDLRGGKGYDGTNGTGSTERWRVFGSNLGLDISDLGAEYGQQGLFRINLGYDELRRNYSDDYQTLWFGRGTSTLTLPAAYPLPAARTGAAGLANWNNIQSPNLNAATIGGGPGYVIPALMHGENISTTRARTSLGGELALGPQWTLAVNARNERKTGEKLTGAAFGGFKGALLPEPIDSDTSIVETALRFVTREAHMSVGYNLSLYRNHVDGWTAEYPFSTSSPGSVLNNRIMMNGAPDNQMHQFTLDGGYRFSPTTKLVVSGAYARMTQNEPFHYQPGTGWNVNGGALSSDSKEIQTNLLARLTMQPTKEVDVTAAFKVDNRDNRSPVGLYAITQYDGTATPTASTTFRNVPLNRKQNQLSLDAKYTLRRGTWLSAGAEHTTVERTADASIDPLSHEINNPFASGKAVENTLRLGARHGFSDAISGQLSYSRSQRRAKDYEEPSPVAVGGSANVGFFAEVPGFRQFFLSDRNRDKLRAAADFQLGEAFALQASVDYLSDRYPVQFGLKKSSGTVFNLDGSYTASDRLSFNAYVTAEDSRSHQDQYQIPVARVTTVPPVIPHAADGSCARFTSATGLPSDYLTDPCRNWTVGQADKVWTVGLGVKSSQWMGGKLTLSGDVLYARARTNVDFSGGTYYNNGIGSFVYIPAQNLPTISSTVTELKLGARYALDKNSSVKVGLLHRRLTSSDPQFDLFGITAVQAYLGPGMTSPQYRVNAVSVSYAYTFR